MMKPIHNANVKEENIATVKGYESLFLLYFNLKMALHAEGINF